mgnify:CR=1 FL=1
MKKEKIDKKLLINWQVFVRYLKENKDNKELFGLYRKYTFENQDAGKYGCQIPSSGYNLYRDILWRSFNIDRIKDKTRSGTQGNLNSIEFFEFLTCIPECNFAPKFSKCCA